MILQGYYYLQMMVNLLINDSSQISYSEKYVAKLKGYLMREEVKALEQGIELEDGFTQPAQVKIKIKIKKKYDTG